MRRILAAFAFTAIAAATHAAEPPAACAALAQQIAPVGGPAFIASYPTAEPGPLKDVAFLYDNAAAAIALVGCGEVGRARRIGDAILAALDHDRFWRDGRLRNGYEAGPAADTPIKLGGWWDAAQNRWLEDGYQVGSATGDAAWAMLALLALDRAGADPNYRDGAARIGAWIATLADTRGAGGFTGGFLGWEPSPARQNWKSTEQNTDLAAAFALLAEATRDPVWLARSEAARRFVDSMWDDGCACFGVGVKEDGVTRNPMLALDADIWPLLALPGMAAARRAALSTAGARLTVAGGLTYSEGGRGIWTEGTAQAALLARLLGDFDEAARLAASVDAERAPGGYYAISTATLDTGFADPASPETERFYYRLPHLAALAWAALAETGFNPFIAGAGLPAPIPAPP